jgi:sugar-specific transcriptional regulator TrmB
MSNFSNIARQDVYRLLEQLQRISLVEKIVAKPAMFKAIPIREVTSILMERRNQKTQALLKESEEFLGSFNKTKSSTESQDNNQFVLIPKREAIVRRIESCIKAAQNKIHVITPWREFSQWMFTFHELWRQAIERGVKIRWITERKPQNVDLALEPIHVFSGNPGFRLRTMAEKTEKRLGIYDGKEVFIAITRDTNAGESQALWTNNPMMIYMLEDYFEMKWQLATEMKLRRNTAQTAISQAQPMETKTNNRP